jgi:peptidoglycan hydrolase FlgJ
MTPALDIASAQANLKAAPVKAPQPTTNATAAKKAASEFESVFISEFLGSMFEGIPTDGPFGGGQGEEMFRSLMLDQYAKQITAQGGFGISKIVTQQLLHAQEHGS